MVSGWPRCGPRDLVVWVWVGVLLLSCHCRGISQSAPSLPAHLPLARSNLIFCGRSFHLSFKTVVLALLDLPSLLVTFGKIPSFIHSFGGGFLHCRFLPPSFVFTALQRCSRDFPSLSSTSSSRIGCFFFPFCPDASVVENFLYFAPFSNSPAARADARFRLSGSCRSKPPTRTLAAN